MGIASMRKKLGMSQHDLAELLGVDQSTVCLWETGKTKPRAKLLPSIAKLFGCTVDDLLMLDTPTE